MRNIFKVMTFSIASLVITACGSKGTETAPGATPEKSDESGQVTGDDDKAAPEATAKPTATTDDDDPMARALHHQNALLQIVADNKANKDEAIAKLEAYVAANEAAIKAASADLERLKETASADHARMARIIQANTPRLQTLMELTQKLMAEAPDVFGDPKVNALVHSVKGL